MNTKRRDNSIVDMLFLLALFGVFLISALFIVLFGANIYKKTATDMDSNFKARTSVAYITEKIRRNDVEGGVVLLQKNGHDTLALRQTTGHGTYDTYLYYADGYLREITLSSGTEFAPETGAKILEMQAFAIEEINESLLAFRVTDTEGIETTFYVSVNAKGGVSHE